MGRGLVFGLIALAVGVAAPAASAAVRHAAPGGDASDPTCPLAYPCDIETALQGASDGDEVIVAPGIYGTETAPAATDLLVNASNLNVHGPAAGGSSTIFSGGVDYGIQFQGSGSAVSDLRVEHQATAFGVEALQLGPSSKGERLQVRDEGSYVVCYLGDGAVLRNSVCHSTGTSVAVTAGAGSCMTACPISATLRNVTAVSAGGFGVQAYGGVNNSTTITAINVIAQGTPDDASAYAADATGSATLTLGYSNYATAQGIGPGTAAVTPAGSGTNQAAAPLFAGLAAGDLHQAPGSPTIDAGTNDADNGTQDVDRSARTEGAATDIGADEFVFPLCRGRTATVVGTFGDDPSLVGTPGNDVIFAYGGNDAVSAGSGADVVCAEAGDDQVKGGAGLDVISGARGPDRLLGGRGRDRLLGEAGGDTLFGQGGTDVLKGGIGGDKLNGGPGRPDVCDGGLGRDRKRSPKCERTPALP